MKGITCLIVEDERRAALHLEKMITLNTPLKILGIAETGKNALELNRELNPDLIFLDMQLPDYSGMEILKVLQGSGKKIVLVTGYSNFAVNGFAHNTLDYLCKPYDKERFLLVAEKIYQSFEGTNSNGEKNISSEGDYLHVKTDQKGKTRLIHFGEIDYIESNNNYIYIYCGAERIDSLATIKDMEDKLPFPQFIRSHKSYIVAIDRIILFDTKEVTLKNRKSLPIGGTYLEGVLAVLNNR
jgi:two-component system, LytTR family, response regulator